MVIEAMEQVAEMIARSSDDPEFQITEAGELPCDWHVIPLGDLLNTPPSYGINAAAVPFDFRYPAYIRITDISDAGRFLPESRASVFHSAAEYYVLSKGDLVLARTGASTGKSYLYDPRDGHLVYAGFLIKVSPDQKNINPKYLRYQLDTHHYWKWVQVNSMRSGQPGINGQQYASFPVPLPPNLEEQDLISEALSDQDELISNLELLIEKKRAIKNGVMQELLTGKRRLPGFSGDWTEENLASFGDVLNGLTYSPADVRDSGTLVLRSSNIQNDLLAFDSNVFVQMDVPQQSTVEPNDLLICVRNGSRDLIGKVAKIDERCTGMAFGAFMAVFRTEYHDFILHKFRSQEIKKQISERLGATINQITNGNLKSFTVLMPPTKEEASAIAELLRELEDEIAALDMRLAKARQIKEGMMQDLLTGKVRLV